MSDWESNDFEEQMAPLPVKKKWDDEDIDEDDVKESWEESDVEEPTPVVVVKQPKISLTQKIEERQAKELLKKAELEKKQKAYSDQGLPETDMEAFERRQRERQMQEDADLENTNDLFAGVSVQAKPEAKTDGASLSMHPKTKDEFDTFAKLMIDRILEEQKSGSYAMFVEQVVRGICDPLKDVDVRKIASTLTSLANEKQKAAKEGKNKKKGKKPVAVVSRGGTDTTNYGNYADDFDDFM